MDLPRSSSDIAIATACPACNGNGGFGSRSRDGGNPHQACNSCEGTGWQTKRLVNLTPAEAEKLRHKLAAIPPP
jgi:DnaJ-class molecular chaperone